MFKYFIKIILFLALTHVNCFGQKKHTSKNNLVEYSYKNLNPNLAPSENFDLSNWKLSIPCDKDKNGKADSVSQKKLNTGFENKKFFYTGKDGGMVFSCPVKGTNTKNSGYCRVELREMLRKENTNIPNKGVNKNNWVFSSAPKKDKKKAAAIDGKMVATLAINRVTTTGNKNHIGRIIIGQIHSNTDEPIRLYYRKLQNNKLGSIYFAHEKNHGKDTYYEMIGSKSSTDDNPINGIALNEVFSYSIKVKGNEMWVTIYREGKNDITQYLDMSESGYDEGGQYQYFKAGIYHVNNSGDNNDYAQATFYKLEVTH